MSQGRHLRCRHTATCTVEQIKLKNLPFEGRVVHSCSFTRDRGSLTSSTKTTLPRAARKGADVCMGLVLQEFNATIDYIAAGTTLPGHALLEASQSFYSAENATQC